MSVFFHRRLPEPFAYAASLTLTAAVLLLCAYLLPGASFHVWLVFGAIGVGVAGLLGGPASVASCAVLTLAVVDYLALMPATAFKVPQTRVELLGFAAFAATSAVTARLAWLKECARVERAKAAAAEQGVEHAAQRRRLLLRLSERSLAGGSFDVLGRNATDAVIDALAVSYCAVLESRPTDQSLSIAASSGPAASSVDRVTIPADVDSQVGYALFAREPVVVSGASADERFQVPPEFRLCGGRSGIAVRIGGASSFGVLVAYDSSPSAFDDAAIQFICAAAAILASASERSRLEQERTDLVARDAARREEAQLAVRRAAFLAHTASVLDAALEPETTLVSLARLAVPAIADCAMVDLVEADGSVRRIDVVDIDPVRRTDVEALRRLPPDVRIEGPFPRAIRTGQPVLVPDLARVAAQSGADGDFVRSFVRMGCQSLLLIPLVARGQTLGLVTLGTRVAGRYEGADLSLAQELAARAAIALDNGRLHQEAQAASRTKDEFLATVSHELRTPLGAVLGWSAVLRSHRLDETRARWALDAIDRSVHAQAKLLEQLLDVSRIISGKFELQKVPAQLSDIVDTALDAVRPAAEARHIRIEANIDRLLPRLTADPDRLGQVATNLLSNAIKFSADQGVVEIELRSGEGATAEILVRDHGVGIQREFLPYVFDRFRQSRMAGVENRGLGLGLAIVREIVHQHGGTIVAESAGEGQGATFRVTLPLGAGDSVRLVPPAPLLRESSLYSEREGVR